MTFPALPDRDSVDWYEWATAVHAALTGGPADQYKVAPGSWWAPHSQGTAAQLLVQNRCCLVPIDMPSSQVWTGVSFEVTTAASGSGVRLGLYGSGSDGMPALTNRVADFGVVDTQTTGQKLLGGLNFSLTRDRYWLAYVAQGGAPTVRSIAGTGKAHPLPQGLVPSAGLFYLQHAISGSVSGALPNTGSVTSSDGLPPKVYLQAQ